MKKIKSKTKDDFNVFINEKIDVNLLSSEVLDGLMEVVYLKLKEILKNE